MLIRYRLCWVIVLYLIFSLFVSSPAYSQSSKVLFLAQRAAESTGDTEFKQGNKEADAILQWMTPAEIETLDTKLAEALTLYYDGKFGQAFRSLMKSLLRWKRWTSCGGLVRAP